jgi:oligopeptide/dipeptide ABC transporter, ATP-binding protein, C-terminal domain
VPDPEAGRDRVELGGEVGDAINVPSGCRFHKRCPEYIGDICETQEPALEQKAQFDADREVACHLYEPADSSSAPTAVNEGSEGSTAADD